MAQRRRRSAQPTLAVALQVGSERTSERWGAGGGAHRPPARSGGHARIAGPRRGLAARPLGRSQAHRSLRTDCLLHQVPGNWSVLGQCCEQRTTLGRVITTSPESPTSRLRLVAARPPFVPMRRRKVTSTVPSRGSSARRRRCRAGQGSSRGTHCLNRTCPDRQVRVWIRGIPCYLSEIHAGWGQPMAHRGVSCRFDGLLAGFSGRSLVVVVCSSVSVSRWPRSIHRASRCCRLHAPC